MFCQYIKSSLNYAKLPEVQHNLVPIVRATPVGTGFVDIFIGQIHSESDDQIQ